MNVILFGLALSITRSVSYPQTEQGRHSDPSSISPIPGDNSQYIDGVSRYIWMPDGDDELHLVDLMEPVSCDGNETEIAEHNEYLLYTRLNQDTAQIIKIHDEKSLNNSNFNPKKPIYVIVHGWMSNGHNSLNPLTKAEILTVEDANVIVLDWSYGANNIIYYICVLRVPKIGEALGDFLIWMVNTSGANWDKIHLIGFSLGAHVVGNAGRRTNSLPARITGLDPAGPHWLYNKKALKSSDAKYVEAIHTNAGILGITRPIADSDFYPNGGTFQPGCNLNCNHGRSIKLFASSIVSDHFDGRKCRSLKDALNQICKGEELKMGNINFNKRGEGIYGLRTKSEWPF